jgi:hypothetical protein
MTMTRASDLDALQGDWDMSGTFLGKPVKYHARGQRVLQGGFLRLHMIDAAAPPARAWWGAENGKEKSWSSNFLTLTPRSRTPSSMTPMPISGRC